MKKLILVSVLLLTGCKFDPMLLNPFDLRFTIEDMGKACTDVGGTINKDHMFVGMSRTMFTSSITMTIQCDMPKR